MQRSYLTFSLRDVCLDFDRCSFGFQIGDVCIKFLDRFRLRSRLRFQCCGFRLLGTRLALDQSRLAFSYTFNYIRVADASANFMARSRNCSACFW